MTYFKFLRPGAVSPFTRYVWPVGEWVSVDATDLCRSGFHACALAHLPYWLGEELWEVELAAPVEESRHKVVARRARLLSRVEAWTPAAARDLGAACVARTIGHAVAELAEAGLREIARRLRDAEDAEIAVAAAHCAEQASAKGAWQAVTLCGYVSDAIEALEAYPVASTAYIAARAADQRTTAESDDPYAAERAWQAGWLATRLRLDRSS
ncbi:hypothetical protein GCM10023196_035020 [Actinoallomurus vinaceus]|uniref:Uncharacterized protein n=1 Tax=Actinoallomurus vinaceus TaxID=1080074 RepID=A0ABP8UBH5_9ACTN